MSRLKSIYKYFNHFITARNTGGHGVHSPFMFQFTRYVLQENHPFYIFDSIEKLRQDLKKDNRILNVTDFGTGIDRKRKVSDIAKKSLKSARESQLIFRIANYIKAANFRADIKFFCPIIRFFNILYACLSGNNFFLGKG